MCLNFRNKNPPVTLVTKGDSVCSCFNFQFRGNDNQCGESPALFHVSSLVIHFQHFLHAPRTSLLWTV